MGNIRVFMENMCFQLLSFMYLHMFQDWEMLRTRMKVIVQRILVDNLPAMEHLQDAVQRHIPHQYSELSSEKSVFVCKFY